MGVKVDVGIEVEVEVEVEVGEWIERGKRYA